MKIQNLGEVEVTYKYHSELANRPCIRDSKQANEILRKLYKKGDLGFQEVFVAIYLNKANTVIGTFEGFKGTTTATLVDFKILMGVGIKLLATGMIIAHNHPSGNLSPSKQDIQITKRVIKCSELFDIKLLDHIILSPTGDFYSFAENNLLT